MPDLSQHLSANFTLGEMLRSATAERQPDLKAEQMDPPDSVLENLEYLARTTLQPVRSRMGYPVLVTSGYRSPGVNRAVGGSSSSQHVQGEAADLDLPPSFLTSDATAGLRREIADRVRDVAGRPMRSDVNQTFYLFAAIVLRLDELDVDQVIHEYGEGFGAPAWVHVSASRRQNRRQILAVGSYTNRRFERYSLEEILSEVTRDE